MFCGWCVFSLFSIPSPCFSAVYFYQRGQIRFQLKFFSSLFFFLEIGLKQIHGIDILFTIRKQDTRTYHDKKIQFQISQHTHSTTTKGNPCLNSSAFFRCWGYVYIYMHAPQVFSRINLTQSLYTIGKTVQLALKFNFAGWLGEEILHK